MIPGAARDDAVLDLLVEALPHLRGGLREESADFTARLLYEHLQLDATAVVSHDTILAFVGLGADHHLVGSPSLTALTHRAIETGEVLRTQDRAVIGCPRTDCPLSAALVAPLIVRGDVVGALKLYHNPGRANVERDEKIALGLARVFSVYLELAELDARAALVTRAELEALRAQISPHFLFNTLTTIAALTRIDAARAHDLIVDFAEFFRDTLSQHRECVRLGEELHYLERYLRFEKARFGERLTIESEIDQRALDALVPVLSVQPLVENAIAHGIAPKAGAGRVRIAARAVEGGYEVSVSDDGIGIPAGLRETILEQGHSSGMGVGLNNVHRRLVGLFGAESGLRIESRTGAGSGTTVRFRVNARASEGKRR
jgi:two-component system, LytTR family, sensor histidine kinase LytS